jgi:HAMP domain-containing protein
MGRNLTAQVRNIAEVTTAVARGELNHKIAVDVKGEILELKNTINTMVDQLNALAGEVSRVAREVGTEDKLGGQAAVPGVAGTWEDLTDNVNFMASNLTEQVRGIVKVVTAVANGNLNQRLAVHAKGEVAALTDTINDMTDTLATFAQQVTNVAREVGVEGRLGGQANVPGAAGTWKDLTGNVNLLAANLTSQVRAIADVATAVTKRQRFGAAGALQIAARFFLGRPLRALSSPSARAIRDGRNRFLGMPCRSACEQETGSAGEVPEMKRLASIYVDIPAMRPGTVGAHGLALLSAALALALRVVIVVSR